VPDKTEKKKNFDSIRNALSSAEYGDFPFFANIEQKAHSTLQHTNKDRQNIFRLART